MMCLRPLGRPTRPLRCLATPVTVAGHHQLGPRSPPRSLKSTKSIAKSSGLIKRTGHPRPSLHGAASGIIIPPTFLDGQVPKPVLRLTREEAAARAARLANPAIVDELRAQGRLSPAHWRFNHDPVRASDKEIARGWSPRDAYKMTNPKYWMYLPRHIRSTWGALKLNHSAYKQLEKTEFLSPTGGMLDVVLKTVKPALERLSYSPLDHAAFTSATTRGLYTPTFFARLSESTSVLRKQGDMSFDLKITDVAGFTDINRLLLLGDHSSITTLDLLGPRIVIPHMGNLFTIMYLEHDVDSVPIWKQSAYMRDFGRHESIQYLIDVVAYVSGTATLARVSKEKHRQTAQATGIEALEDPIVFQESFEDRRIVIRFASNPFLFDQDDGDLNINLRSTWRVADIDYLTSKLLIERGKKLALCLSKMERT